MDADAHRGEAFASSFHQPVRQPVTSIRGRECSFLDCRYQCPSKFICGFTEFFRRSRTHPMKSPICADEFADLQRALRDRTLHFALC